MKSQVESHLNGGGCSIGRSDWLTMSLATMIAAFFSYVRGCWLSTVSWDNFKVCIFHLCVPHWFNLSQYEDWRHPNPYRYIRLTNVRLTSIRWSASCLVLLMLRSAWWREVGHKTCMFNSNFQIIHRVNPGSLRVVPLRDRCKIPMGKPGTGSVVSHSRKSGCGLVEDSNFFSSPRKNRRSKWQFWSMSHNPLSIAISK